MSLTVAPPVTCSSSSAEGSRSSGSSVSFCSCSFIVRSFRPYALKTREGRHIFPRFGDTADVADEAKLEQTDEGLVAKTDGWFVLNARDARWYHAEGRSAFCDFEGATDWKQLGVNLSA